MLERLIASTKFKYEYTVTKKQIKPLINMSKYISFFAYRPYLDKELPEAKKYMAYQMMKLRSGYHVYFERFVQNEITHELIYDFILSVDDAVRYEDILQYYDELLSSGFFNKFEAYKTVSRLREVLVVLEENNIDIRCVDTLSKKKLARKAIDDYRFFDFTSRKSNTTDFVNSIIRFVPRIIREFIFKHRVIIISFVLSNIFLWYFYF